jgi:hypothetical protein
LQEVTDIAELADVAVPNFAFCHVNYGDHAFAKVCLAPLVVLLHSDALL